MDLIPSACSWLHFESILQRLACIALVSVPITACVPEAAPQSARAADQPAPVMTALVQTLEYAAPIEAIGTALALESVLVTSRVQGRVSEVYLREGTHVRKGDPLVLLESDEERARLRSATAGAEQAIGRFERLKELSSSNLISRDELEAQRRILDTLQAELDLAKVMLEQRTIRAPFSGTVGFRRVSPGTLVLPGAAIVTLDSIDTIRVAFSIAETLLADVAVGTKLSVRAAAYRGRDFVGRVETIGTRVDETTRALPVQALVGNPKRLLKPGMLLTLNMSGTPRTLRYIPEAAVAPENAQQFSWRITPDGSAEKVVVELGVRAQGWVEIIAGLDEGDRVVIEGIANLRPGRQVREVSRTGEATPTHAT